MIGSAVIHVAGGIFGTIFEIIRERAFEIRRKTDVIQSLIALQRKHGPVKYKFAVDRSFAQGTDREMRRTIVNGLIYEGIIEEDTSSSPPRLWIDEDGEALEEYWRFLDDIQENLAALQKK